MESDQQLLFEWAQYSKIRSHVDDVKSAIVEACQLYYEAEWIREDRRWEYLERKGIQKIEEQFTKYKENLTKTDFSKVQIQEIIERGILRATKRYLSTNLNKDTQRVIGIPISRKYVSYILKNDIYLAEKYGGEPEFYELLDGYVSIKNQLLRLFQKKRIRHYPYTKNVNDIEKITEEAKNIATEEAEEILQMRGKLLDTPKE